MDKVSRLRIRPDYKRPIFKDCDIKRFVIYLLFASRNTICKQVLGFRVRGIGCVSKPVQCDMSHLVK